MWRHIALLFLASAAPLAAQSVSVSDGPQTVSLTVYRGDNSGNVAINKDWPTGYALITETRTVQIPAGEGVIRFEGVAEGMFPESAIVTGLPNGVREKNRDARLLSPSGLVDAYLKRAVTLTRTNIASGKVTSQEAFITAGPSGGVILQTSEGYEALRCTGLPERMAFGGVPANLSAKPTLSVLTTSDRATTVKLTLTYMAAGFDWQANYVAQVKDRKDDGTGKVDIFAWLTLANGGNQSFLNANMMAIAGAPNRQRRGEQPRPVGGALTLTCWPMQRTDQVPLRLGYELPSPEPVSSPMMMMDAVSENIMVTGNARKSMRMEMAPVAAVVAEQEDLGDLKLYRMPEPVSVNAKGQKQVAMLVQPGATFQHIYHATVRREGKSGPMQLLLRGTNKKDKGLGLPMPQGQVMVFEDSNYGPLLAGETVMKDRAVGEEVEIAFGQSADVRMAVTKVSERGKTQKWKVEITNARGAPVHTEVEIPYQLMSKSENISKIDGVPTWKATLPANGEASLYYEVKLDRGGI